MSHHVLVSNECPTKNIRKPGEWDEMLDTLNTSPEEDDDDEDYTIVVQHHMTCWLCGASEQDVNLQAGANEGCTELQCYPACGQLAEKSIEMKMEELRDSIEGEMHEVMMLKTQLHSCKERLEELEEQLNTLQKQQKDAQPAS